MKKITLGQLQNMREKLSPLGTISSNYWLMCAVIENQYTYVTQRNLAQSLGYALKSIAKEKGIPQKDFIEQVLAYANEVPLPPQREGE